MAGKSWRQPSIDELQAIYKNKASLNISLSMAGGTLLDDDKTWSATQYSTANMWYLDMSVGSTDKIDKSFMALTTSSSGVVSVNGFVSGNIYSGIINTSVHDIIITKFEIVDTSTKHVVWLNTESHLLKAAEKIDLGGSLNSVFMPKFSWYFTFNGKSYSISHNYQLPPSLD